MGGLKPIEVEQILATQRRYDRQAALYDLMEAPMELLAFKRLRQRLWGEVKGPTVLEVGAGTGKNFPHHPPEARTVAMDISSRMLRRASSRARRLGRDVYLILADAQHLPFRDNTFDTVINAFVFCSVPDPIAGLREVRRVVRDDGGIRMLEHVRAASPMVGRLMDLMNPVAVRMSGASINRDTVSNVHKAGIALDSVESRGFGVLKLIRGSAGREVPSQGERRAPEEEGRSDVAR
jgi:ubiquinone/menaquinone biosynthesis C-methylase UbiE